ncbi:hypothetical protein A2U01_0093263, partial [Trifolium medium]|nr:hypothetical protein [Trifolium medium]
MVMSFVVSAWWGVAPLFGPKIDFGWSIREEDIV